MVPPPRLLPILCALLVPSPGHAYSIGSPLTRGCHERITAEALRRVRAMLPTAPPIPPTEDEQPIIDDLPYFLDPEVRDMGGTSITLAVRDNDTFGNDPLNEVALAQIAGNPDHQRQHCLRRPEQDEPEGTPAALADCTAFIRERAALALDGLDAQGVPDAANRVELPVYLAIRGPRTPLNLPLFYVRMGQALHALQDSFSHGWHSTDNLRVTVVLNWVDYVDGTLVEARDGPAHSTRLDTCDEGDPEALRVREKGRAVEASTEALVAVLSPGLDRAARMAALDAVLARYLGYQPGCSAENAWCMAPEQRLGDSGCFCRIGSPRDGAGAAGTACSALVLLGALARRRRAARGAVVGLLVALLFAGVAGVLAEGEGLADGPRAGVAEGCAPVDAGADGGGRPANAADDVPVTVVGDGGSLVLPPPLAAEMVETRERKRPGPRFGLSFGAGASVDRPAFAFQVGARFRYNTRWIFGIDAEWNPFLSIDRSELRAGAFNIYGTVILRFPLRFERINLRTTGYAGLSIGLLDVYGAPRGSVGPFVALAPLGIDVDLGHAWRFVLNPVELVLPVPHVTGLPFFYPQYRLSAGFQFGS